MRKNRKDHKLTKRRIDPSKREIVNHRELKEHLNAAMDRLKIPRHLGRPRKTTQDELAQ